LKTKNWGRINTPPPNLKIMKTIICDIDGTITNMEPIEKVALLKSGKLPPPERYPLADWIFINKNKYHFVYATGGQQNETLYVLKSLGLARYFDLRNSISKTNCRFSKKTGIPLRKIKAKFKDCILITDSKDDCRGADLAGIPFILVKPRQKLLNLII